MFPGSNPFGPRRVMGVSDRGLVSSRCSRIPPGGKRDLPIKSLLLIGGLPGSVDPSPVDSFGIYTRPSDWPIAATAPNHPEISIARRDLRQDRDGNAGGVDRRPLPPELTAKNDRV